MLQGFWRKALKAACGKVRILVADPQYSSRRLRTCMSNHGIKPVILPFKPKADGRGVLSVDKLFRAHGLKGFMHLRLQLKGLCQGLRNT
jgi:hypothetical protein